MAQDEDEFLGDEQPARNARRTPQSSTTERFSTRELPRGEPVRSDWRSGRTGAQSTRQRSVPMPSSRQEFVVWLQNGGWRTAALVAAGTFAAIMLMLVFFNRARPLANERPAPTAQVGVGGNIGGALLPTADPLFQPSPTPEPAAPAATVGASFRVINTEGQGLFLRSDHVRDPANIVETLPDGTVVTVIGEDFSDGTVVWKNVRAPSGQEGWAASTFLEQVQS